MIHHDLTLVLHRHTFHQPHAAPAGHNLPPTTKTRPYHLSPSTRVRSPTYYGTSAHRFCRVMTRAKAAPRRQQKKKQSYVEPQTQSSEKLPSSQESWFEIKEIVCEDKSSYRIFWEGEDPATGQPWRHERVRVTPQLTIPVGLGLTGVCDGRSRRLRLPRTR